MIVHQYLLSIAMVGLAVYISVGSVLAVSLTASDVWNDSILRFEKSNGRGSNIAAWEEEPSLRLWEFLGHEDMSALFNVLESPHIKNGTFIDLNLPIIDRMMGIYFMNSLNITDRNMIPLNFKFNPTYTVISRPEDTVFGVSEESQVGEDGKKIEKDSKTEPLVGSTSLAVQFLASRMDVFHKTFDVYTDFDSPGNHFQARLGLNEIPLMDETFRENPHSGLNSIRASFQSSSAEWGAWFFLNGMLKDNHIPVVNWAQHPHAGIDLSGANAINFWARGTKGGEMVEFFAFGVGINSNTQIPEHPFPDSSNRVSQFISLSKKWQSYSLDLRKKDLSYVLGGFGWVSTRKFNFYEDITFFIDDIQIDKTLLGEPRFLVNFEIIKSPSDTDVSLRSIASVYDNAFALFAFLAMDNLQEAKLIADAFVYVQKHDRFFEDGRIRNAYRGGDLAQPPGWVINGKAETARMPGWYDPKRKKWTEDKSQVGTETGNVAWAILALLAYNEVADSTDYLISAERMGEWVDHCCHDARGAGGYQAGFEGLDSNQVKLQNKSTQHNIFLFAAFERLYKITGRKVWRKRALHAKKFVLAMWDETTGKFWTETKNDGVTINKSVFSLETQSMAILAFGEKDRRYRKAYQYLESSLSLEDGVELNPDLEVVFYKEIAQVVVASQYVGQFLWRDFLFGRAGNKEAMAYQYMGQMAKSEQAMDFLKKVQSSSGGLPSTNQGEQTSGLTHPREKQWVNGRLEQVGATAWLVLAEKRFNPFLGYTANTVKRDPPNSQLEAKDLFQDSQPKIGHKDLGQ